MRLAISATSEKDEERCKGLANFAEVVEIPKIFNFETLALRLAMLLLMPVVMPLPNLVMLARPVVNGDTWAEEVAPAELIVSTGNVWTRS